MQESANALLGAARQGAMTLLPLAVVSALLLSCARQSEWATKAVWPGLESAHLPSQQDYPDAGAVVLLDEGRMEVFGGGELGFSSFDHHRLLKILNSRGHGFAYVVVPYGLGSQVEDIRGRTVSPAGKITVLDEKNIFDVNLYPNFVFFSDQRAKIFTLPAVEDGAVIEYEYKVVIRSRTFWHSWTFQSAAPTVLSRFTLLKPSQWGIMYRTYALDIQPVITKAPEGFKSTHTWEARDIPALQPEFSMPPKSERAARLAMSPVGFKTWQDVSLWYHGLAEPRMKVGASVESLAKKMIAGSTDDREKLRRIYEWVRDEIRYVAVEIGIGGFQPHEADEVCLNKYGDCKDMTTLLCALGREAGLDVRQTLVSTWQNGKPDTSLPSPLQFNHVIAWCPTVGDGGTWMDATEKGCPFGELPWYDQGLPVLVTGPRNEEKIIVTPKVRAEANRELLQWRVTLDSSGDAVVAGRSLLRGAPAVELREDLAFASFSDMRRWIEVYLAKKCAGIQLDSFRVAGVSAVTDSLELTYHFRTRMLTTRRGKTLVVRPGSLVSTSLPMYFRAVQRTHPVRFRFGMCSEFDLSVRLPGGWHANGGAMSDTVSSPYGSSWWKRWEHNGTFHAQAAVTMDGIEVPPEDYPALRRFLDAVSERDLREVEFGL